MFVLAGLPQDKYQVQRLLQEGATTLGFILLGVLSHQASFGLLLLLQWW